jgi:bifunctional enzyme CysN/CysC
MVTGASNAQVAVILIDAQKGVSLQTKRHSFIASLLSIKKIVVVINKMDLMSYSESVFNSICEEYKKFVLKLGFSDIQFIPISALHGDNLSAVSDKMPWYKGDSLLRYLENVYVGSERNLLDFRYSVQYVIKDAGLNRFFAGQIQSGAIRPGEEVLVLPSMKKTKIKSISTYDGELDYAVAPQAVAIRLEDELDISRGDMIVRPGNQPNLSTRFDAMVVWLSEAEMNPEVTYSIQMGTRSSKVDVKEIRYQVNADSLHRESANTLKMNAVGRLDIQARKPMVFDSYARNRNTGSFILIHPESQATVAAGFILDHSPHFTTSAGAKSIWLTGLSGAGKTTIAQSLVKECEDFIRIVGLDGDLLRTGLNADLGFSREDRSENIRRTAEVAKILNGAGINCVISLISPYAEDRDKAKKIIGAENFIEVYISTPLEICEKRDPKGLYKKARNGEILNFTGISDSYEPPLSPDLVLDTNKIDLSDCVKELLKQIKR